jgi:hypothetical protein
MTIPSLWRANEYIDSVSHETVRQVLKKRIQALAEETMVHSAPPEC